MLLTVHYVTVAKTDGRQSLSRDQPLSDINQETPTTYQELNENTQEQPVNYQQLPTPAERHNYYNVTNTA